MISVLTVTKRTGWEKIASDSLARQTFQDFEWIIVTEEDLPTTSYPSTIYKAPPKKRGTVSNLNASLNAGLRHCEGEYVVFYQDFIILEDDCIEKLMNLVGPMTFVTTLTRNPPGVEADPRYHWLDEPRFCIPQEWEANVAIAPMGILNELGGFDEEYDYGWSWDNCNVAERAEMLGCTFLLDETNNPQLLYHKKETDLNPELKTNGDFHDKRMEDIRAGRFPLRLKYL